MGKMLAKLPPSGCTDFNEQDYHCICALNNQLEEAQRWIDRRSREMIAAYGLAAARARHTETLNEDVGLVATILFLVCEGHPTFRPERTNILARIDIPILPASGTGENSAYQDSNTAPCSAQIGGSDWNPLFLNLYERILQRDMAKLLSIGALCIDVALIEQQLRSW